VTGRAPTELFYEWLQDRLAIQPGVIGRNPGPADPGVADHGYDSATNRFIRLRAIPFGVFWEASLSKLTLSPRDLIAIARYAAGFELSEEPAKSRPARLAPQMRCREFVRLPSMTGGDFREEIPSGFALGCAAYRQGLLGHNGSARGQTCGLRFHPMGITVAVGINCWQPFLRDKIMTHLFEWVGGILPPAVESTPLEFPLEELTGGYSGPMGMELTITREGRTLNCGITSQRAAHAVRIAVRQDTHGCLQMAPGAQHHSIGFFRSPSSDQICAMFGLTAWRKN
jgi:hypothetical protein